MFYLRIWEFKIRARSESSRAEPKLGIAQARLHSIELGSWLGKSLA